MKSIRRRVVLIGCMALCLCAAISGCGVDVDPPEINALPRCDDKIEMDSGDFRDNLVYGEYHYASYTPEKLETYLENSGMFTRATEKEIERFYNAVQQFEGLLHGRGANEKFTAQYYTDEEQLVGRFDGIVCDEHDWFAYSAYGYFWYDTETQTVYQYHV